MRAVVLLCCCAAPVVAVAVASAGAGVSAGVGVPVAAVAAVELAGSSGGVQFKFEQPPSPTREKNTYLMYYSFVCSRQPAGRPTRQPVPDHEQSSQRLLSVGPLITAETTA